MTWELGNLETREIRPRKVEKRGKFSSNGKKDKKKTQTFPAPQTAIKEVADPDPELREGGGGGQGGCLFACPTGFSSFCDFFSPKISYL